MTLPLFRDAVLLYPAITAAHIAEEWRGFPAWARRFASPRYTRREYVIAHAAALAIAVAAMVLVRAFPASWAAWLFFAVLFGPSVACNALFHLASTVLTRTYCPGAVTSAVLYVLVTIVLASAVLRDRLLSPATLAAAVMTAAVFHVVEVGHNVFKRW